MNQTRRVYQVIAERVDTHGSIAYCNEKGTGLHDPRSHLHGYGKCQSVAGTSPAIHAQVSGTAANALYRQVQYLPGRVIER